VPAGHPVINVNRSLWIVQLLLAVIFLFAGGMKLFLPVERWSST
jgi:hypothetical protein